jgi:hypothetical protein
MIPTLGLTRPIRRTEYGAVRASASVDTLHLAGYTDSDVGEIMATSP